MANIKFNEVTIYYIIFHFILLNDSQVEKNNIMNENNSLVNINDDKNSNNSDKILSFESVSSIKKSNNSSSSSSSASPITEKKDINKSAINQNEKLESKNNSEIFHKLNLNLTNTNISILPKISKLLNYSINNSYNSSLLNINKKKPINKSLLFLKTKYKFIKPYTSKGFDSKKIKFQNELMELQNFKADSEQIWVASLDHLHNYLATGGKSGVLKIWKMNTLEDDNDKYNNSLLFSEKKDNDENKELKTDEEAKNYLNIIDETVYKIYCEHTLDIIDIAWSKKYINLLVSVSLDQKAVLYDIKNNSSIKIFLHKNAITSVSFYPDKLLSLNLFLNDKNTL